MNTVLRGTAAALSAMLLAQNAGCGSAPEKTELQMACGEGGTEVRSGSAGAARRATFEYRPSAQARCALVAPSSRYTVAATVEWSNGWRRGYEITTDLDAESDQRYLVRAYEKDNGEVPVSALALRGYISTPAKILIYAVAVPVLAVVFVLEAPFALVGALFGKHQPQPPKPTEEPSKDCCFTWIERGSTGEVLAGARPDSNLIRGFHAQQSTP